MDYKSSSSIKSRTVSMIAITSDFGRGELGMVDGTDVLIVMLMSPAFGVDKFLKVMFCFDFVGKRSRKNLDDLNTRTVINVTGRKFVDTCRVKKRASQQSNWWRNDYHALFLKLRPTSREKSHQWNGILVRPQASFMTRRRPN